MFQTLLSFLLAGSITFAGTSFSSTEHFDGHALLNVSPLPQKQVEFVAPGYTSATSILSIDLESQSVLFEKNSNAKVPTASLTKLMTAALILEENHPDNQVTVSGNAASTLGSTMNLRSGEVITVRDLLYGLLINSANDAAVALAEFNAGSESEFVAKMNDKAKRLGMESTNYANATGLDSSIGHSSARDLALLSSHLAKDPNVRAIVKLQSAEIAGHGLENTNDILGELGIKGMKTGKTPAAGECLVTLAESPSGHEVITVILGSSNRFADSRTVIDWIYRAYTW